MVFVSVVCPTYNRHRFIDNVIHQFSKQIYDPKKMELIILDDTQTTYPFLIEDERVRYIHDNTKRYMLWEKRNILNDLAKGEIIICMDDDDFSFENRITKSVDMLINDPKTLIVGTSSLYIYDILTQNMYFFKANQDKHIMNGTFAYRKSITKISIYKQSKLNEFEEKTFTCNFTLKSKLMDHKDCLICISSGFNTIDKTRFCNSNTIVALPDFEYNLTNLTNLTPIIYWINLKRDLKRKKYMMDQLSNMKYSIRIEAIEDPCLVSKYYSKEQISCLFSHFKAMKISLQDKERDYCIICEDDINFKNIKNFQEIIHYYLKSAPPKWDVLQLFNIQNKEKISSETNILKWEKWTQCHFSTMIYIIKKKYIHKLLDCKEKINNLTKGLIADTFIYNKGIVYSLSNPYFLDNIEFDSNICIENKKMHQDNHNLLKKHQDNMKKKYPFD